MFLHKRCDHRGVNIEGVSLLGKGRGDVRRLPREDIGDIDVLKYVHHGFARDAAAEDMLSFNSKYILLSTQLATAKEAMLAIEPDTRSEILNCGLDTYKFAVNDDGELKVRLIPKVIATE